MNKAGFEVVVGSFKKNGIIYHAAITFPLKINKETKLKYEYQVLLSHPDKKTISFKIKNDEDGRWMPNKRNLVDPWIADKVGHIIETKIINTP